MQQLFLRWNFGQELRQALITVAISIVLADQMLVHFGGVAADDQPAAAGSGQSVPLHVYGLQYPLFRLFVLAMAVVVGARAVGDDQAHALRHGHPGRRRRPGDDVGARGQRASSCSRPPSSSARALAALGGVLGGTMLSLAPGSDSDFLISSLVVVIIGGLGSLRGRGARGTPARARQPALERLSAVGVLELFDPAHVRAPDRRARDPAGRLLRKDVVSVRRALTFLPDAIGHRSSRRRRALPGDLLDLLHERRRRRRPLDGPRARRASPSSPATAGWSRSPRWRCSAWRASPSRS